MEPDLEISSPHNDARHHFHAVALAQTPPSWLLALGRGYRLFGDFVTPTLWRRPPLSCCCQYRRWKASRAIGGGRIGGRMRLRRWRISRSVPKSTGRRVVQNGHRASEAKDRRRGA